jgi:FeS assembly SUF system protein
MVSREEIINVLKNIYDPEIPVNIWDLGLIYDIGINADGRVHITMTFTSPTCPMMEEILEMVKHNTESLAGAGNADVQLVWEPAWDISRMSEQARIELDLTESGW